MQATQPVLFVSHGAPTLALDGGAWGAALKQWADGLAVRAVLVLSAHWESTGPIRVQAHAAPETLHDFGGFPEPLYRIRYPAPGHPALAIQVVGLIQAAGLAAQLDQERPFDHGAWVPLRAAFPDAQVPVIQVSLPVPRTPRMLFELGRALSPLRAEGVLLVASGGIVHNLGLLDWAGTGAPEPWASGFETWVEEGLAEAESRLFQAAAQAPAFERAVPTPEHFDPLLFALGAAGGSKVRTLFQGWQLGNLSLRTWVWDEVVAE